MNAVQGPREARRRLFFAYWPTDAERRHLHQCTRPLLAGIRGRPVPAERLHLTLAFLGAVPASGLDALLRLGAALGGAPAAWRFDALEYWRSPRVLALVASEVPTACLALHEALWRGLEPLGFQRDSRPFRPHLTLARPVHGWLREPAWLPVEWQPRTLALVESLSGPQGLEYRPLAEWPLLLPKGAVAGVAL